LKSQFFREATYFSRACLIRVRACLKYAVRACLIRVRALFRINEGLLKEL